MSAADHSLRELVWMAEGRGLLAAWEFTALAARLPLTAAVLNPGEVNPFRVGPAESRAMEELRRWQGKRAWAAANTPKRR